MNWLRQPLRSHTYWVSHQFHHGLEFSIMRTLIALIALATGPLLASEATELIDADYRMQFLVYQRAALPGYKLPVTTVTDAAGGVDGLIDGKHDFHTPGGGDDWWQVDLGEAVALDRAVIWNRTDRAAPDSHLRLQIQLSADGQAWETVYRHPGKPFGGRHLHRGKKTGDDDPLTVPLAQRKARYLRLLVEKDEKNPRAPTYLCLDEIEVFAAADPTVNIARGKPADQSSVSRWSQNSMPTPREQATAQWVSVAFPRGYSPTIPDSYLDSELLRAYAAACAERGLQAAERLRQSGAGVPPEAAQIQALADRLAAQPQDRDGEALMPAYLALRHAIRPVILARSAYRAIDEIVFYTRRDGLVFPDVAFIHSPWYGSPGGDIHVLRLDHQGTSFGERRSLLKGRLDPGHVRGFELHWDADRLLFGWTHGEVDVSTKFCRPGHKAFTEQGCGWIYEYDLQTDTFRQVTTAETKVHDAEPCYLPDGRIAFMSNRGRSSVQCNQSQHEMFAQLYACDPDGTHLERLSNTSNADQNPRVLDDGRIAYLRWEYNERHSNILHPLWAMRADGTYEEPIYGQYDNGTGYSMFTDARNIPGSHKLMIITSQHYNMAQGAIHVLDPSLGIRNPAAISPLTPWMRMARGHGPNPATGFFADPWPLAEDLALVSYQSSHNQLQVHGYGLYLTDGSGNLELIYRDPEFSSRQAVPLTTRKRPPATPRMCAMPPADGPGISPVGYRLDGTEGTCYLSDVMQGLELPEGMQPAILRISENLPLPYSEKWGESNYSDGNNWTPKRIVGEVALDKNGGASFTVPADRALYFQLLDADGRELRRMRSWVSLKHGESRSCTGCHEGQLRAPSAAPGGVARRQVQKPVTKVSWGQKPVSYQRDIRPIVDRHCLDCHVGSKAPRKLDFAKQPLNRLERFGNRGGDLEITAPLRFGSHKSRILAALAKPAHKSVKLSAQERYDLQAWIDLSGPMYDRCQMVAGPFYGYTPEGVVVWEAEGRRAPQLRVSLPEAVAQSCTACHADLKTVLRPEWVDLRNPERSYILRAPLAKKAGGLERCKKVVFADTKSPGYQALLAALRDAARPCWQSPDNNFLPLVEAGLMPEWARIPKPSTPQP